MYEKAEEEYQELTKKKEQIGKDKQKLMDVIKELDEKKNEALEKTWRKVNKDFGSIFSTLLKGAEARLEPPEGKNKQKFINFLKFSPFPFAFSFFLFSFFNLHCIILLTASIILRTNGIGWLENEGGV